MCFELCQLAVAGGGFRIARGIQTPKPIHVAPMRSSPKPSLPPLDPRRRKTPGQPLSELTVKVRAPAGTTVMANLFRR
jgi:hypothetical protein